MRMPPAVREQHGNERRPDPAAMTVRTQRRHAAGLLTLVFAGAFSAVTAPAAGQVGTVAFANSGAPAAQPAFLEGLALLHNFEYGRAARAFREAQRIDPDFAMAYWGEAMTYNHGLWFEQDSAAARAVLVRLAETRPARRAKAKTTREQDWLDAVETLYGEGSGPARDSAYAIAMQRMHQAYPDDAEAAAFYALALLGTAHDGRHIPTYMRAAAIVEETFRDHPGHPGAAHYLIHAYDDPVHAPLGMRAARAYSVIAPDAGHAQHMTSHIFVAMGMWDDVVKANENATRVVDMQRAAAGQPASACGHYNYWLEYGYLMQGRTAAAKRLLTECRDRAVGDPGASHGSHTVDPDNTLIGSLIQMRTRFLLDTDDWTGDVAGWTLTASLAPAMRVSLAFTDGYGAWRRGDLDAARSALETLARARNALGPAVRTPTDAFAVRAAILEQELTGIVALMERRGDDAVRVLSEAARAEEVMPFEFGPPFVDKPTHELLGDVLMKLYRSVEAAAAYEAALARAPQRVPALHGLAGAAEAAGNVARADEARRRIAAIRSSAGR